MQPNRRERILAFADGRLAPGEAAAIERELATDAEAAALLATYRAASDAVRTDDSVEAPAEVIARARAVFDAAALPRKSAAGGLIERIQRLVAQLVYDSRVQPSLVGLRGRGEGFQLSFEAAGAEIDLQAEPSQPGVSVANDDEGTAGGGAGGWRVVGQVMMDQPVSGGVVSMIAPSSGEIVAQSACDDSGTFVLRAAGGRFEIDIELPDRTITLEGIEFP